MRTPQRQLQRTFLTSVVLLTYTADPFPLCCPQLQVIIIIYLSVVGALLLYMAFLVLVDPLIRKADPYTQPLHNEEDGEVRGLGVQAEGPENGGQGNSDLLVSSDPVRDQHYCCGATYTGEHSDSYLCRSCRSMRNI